jgi:N-acetylmuramoyl-L-alanine amidase
MKKFISVCLVSLTLSVCYAQFEGKNQFENLRLLVKDTVMYQKILTGEIEIAAIESGLRGRATGRGNTLTYPIKIAIDPGHVATNKRESEIEERFIYLDKDRNLPKVFFYEARNTLATSYLIKELLERQGFQVMITRDDTGTSLGMSYTNWYDKFRFKTLTEELQNGLITQEQHDRFVTLDEKDLFNQFFNFLDIRTRIDKINSFEPDVTLILHYNASEFRAIPRENAPVTEQNYSVYFVPGGFTNTELNSPTQATDVRRLVSSLDVQRSVSLSQSVSQRLYEAFQVEPISTDANIPWVNKYAVQATPMGVYGRNLYLTRTIQSPLCYAEPFVQNNRSFIYKLNEKTMEIKGLKGKFPPILQSVARAYYLGVLDYFKKGEFSIVFK